MKYLVAALAVLAPVLLVWALAAGVQKEASAALPEPVGPADGAGGHDELERRVDALSEELRQLSAEVARLASRPRESAAAFPPSAARPADSDPPVEGFTPQWYLEQYVASFHDGGEGSEYFRLAVEAYAPTLVPEIAAWVLDGSANPLLRVKLVGILGDPRFRDNGLVIDALLSLLRTLPRTDLAVAGLVALQRTGNERSVLSLEKLAWRFADPTACRQAVQVAVELAGDGANRTLLRLLQTAPDDPSRALVLALLRKNDPEGALEVFRYARAQSVPIRLQAAKLVGGFRGPDLEAFVEQWIVIETDDQVRAVLEAALKTQKQVPRWHPMRATGPPNVADPTRDDQEAWATQAQDGGHEWIELRYATAIRAHAVRIRQVLSPGAVVEVIAIDTGGTPHSVWKGVDADPKVGFFEVRFPRTSYPVQGVRVVLDTSRAPGWNEIDAVELVGPGARAWAVSAEASSYYGG